MRERFGEYCIALFVSIQMCFGCSKKNLEIHGGNDGLNVRGNISNRAKEVLENMQNYFHSREQNSLQSLRTRRIPAIGG